MQRVHFIAIGGAAMHNLAIAVKKKNNFQVTGSDDEIYDPSYTRLKENGLLPDEMGWFPDRIHKGLSAVILGMHATENNPELIRARELGLKIYSYPEYLFHQTRSKTRIVVGGSHGKTTTTAMIIWVLKQLRMDPDFLVGAKVEGFENMVKLTYDSRVAVFEGDEYLTSPLDRRPKFHLYKPHIAVLTGIAWDHANVFPTFQHYVEQFRKFAELMEFQGRLIYFDGDENLNAIAENVRRDIISFNYHTAPHSIENGVTTLKTKFGEFPLKIFGKHNLQNIEAARLACRQVGVTDEQFYHAISDFPGVSKRQQIVAQTATATVFTDFAHSPSKVKATIEAMKEQFPDRKLIACYELHTFSSLTESFLPEYKNTMQQADVAIVYYNHEVIRQKQQQALDENQILNGFDKEDLQIFSNKEALNTFLAQQNYTNTTLLMMSSGNFSGTNLSDLAHQLLNQ